jgi:hypothetical protein
MASENEKLPSWTSTTPPGAAVTVTGGLGAKLPVAGIENDVLVVPWVGATGEVTSTVGCAAPSSLNNADVAVASNELAPETWFSSTSSSESETEMWTPVN